MKALLVFLAFLPTLPATESHPTKSCYACNGTGWDHSKIRASEEGWTIWISLPGVKPFPILLPKFEGSWHCDGCHGQGKIRQ
jgi:hypothetical protein